MNVRKFPPTKSNNQPGNSYHTVVGGRGATYSATSSLGLGILAVDVGNTEQVGTFVSANSPFAVVYLCTVWKNTCGEHV